MLLLHCDSGPPSRTKISSQSQNVLTDERQGLTATQIITATVFALVKERGRLLCFLLSRHGSMAPYLLLSVLLASCCKINTFGAKLDPASLVAGRFGHVLRKTKSWNQNEVGALSGNSK